MEGALTRAIRDSFDRAANRGDVMARFYDRFFASHEEVRERFQKTDMRRQQMALRESLDVAILLTEGRAMAVRVLERLRESHGPSGLAIPPYLYDFWRDSLVAAVAELDPEFSPALERKWKLALQPAIEVLVSNL